MATSNSQRVSIIIILVLFAVMGVGGTTLAILNSKSADTNSSDSSKQDLTKLAGKPLADFKAGEKTDKLVITDIKVGDGAEAKPGDTLTVDYTGAVAATGIVFQSSKDSGQPATFSLDGVIKGWQDGVPGMKVGGKRRLLIPAADAYGEQPPEGSGIPANADLVFDIELHKIGQ